MTLDTAQHKQILMGLLKDIYLTPYLGSRLGFKGVTAAMLFYELPRWYQSAQKGWGREI